MKAEEAIAKQMGVPWQKRGPSSGPYSQTCDSNDPTTWRGQQWRARKSNADGGRWGNGGGKHKWFFDEIHRVKNGQRVTYQQAYNMVTAKYGGDPRKAKT